MRQNLFTLLTKFLLIILPFYVIIKVFFEYKLWVNYFGIYIKEFILVLLFLTLIYEYIKKKLIPKLDILDYLILWYFWYWITITLLNWLWLNSIFYWWRYDFIFFITFLIFRHWFIFLKTSKKELLRLFIFSSSISLFIWFCVKFITWEEILTFFWYNYYVSNWSFSGSVPIYHWVENSWLRRFQWLMDWPNQMAFFLIFFSSIILSTVKKKIEFHIWLIIWFLFILLLLTYSRSALLGIFWALWVIFLINIKTIFNKYRKQFLVSLVWLTILLWVFYIVFERKINQIIFRAASTAWHFERMDAWIDKFLEKPLWHWLATSWPWYRSVYPDKISKEEEINFIPESWFIQQLVEWWIIYFLLFISILWIIIKELHRKNIALFWWLIAILIMNIFLHIFEATYLSILLFSILWLTLHTNAKKETNK